MEVTTGATGATGSLLMKLGELLQDEYNLKDKVKKDIESIQHELIFVNATVRVMEEVPLDQLDEQAQVWVIFIKELSYDMSDIVSTFFVRVLVIPYLPGFIRKAFNMLCMGMNHHQIAGMVKEIRSLIKEVTELRERYRLDDIVTRPITPVVLPQRENMWTRYLAADYEEVARQDISITYEEPMAVEEDMKVLHNWITSGDGNDCMCLVGPGGVGKTTIAMALYRNYGDQFQRRVMVNGSHASGESEAVFVDILNQLKSQELQAHDGNAYEIRAELRECFQGKRFLILLDDVRSKYVFYEIRSLLSDIEKGSRVLVTTRFEAVAREFKRYRRDCVHEVGLLSDEKARQLFMEVVGKENKEKIPTILWEICRGLPLAIITVAKHVACNPEKTENEWRMFCSSLQPSTSTSNTTYQLMKVLRTCYIDMPLDIKMCALYLSMFPRGRKIRKKYLTRQLISQGFVIEQQGLSVEEVAETYFHHLIRRKFIRAMEHGSNGKVKSYQVHDLVLEYIVSEASRVNFATTFGGCRPPFGSKVRRFFANYNISLEHGERVEMMNLSHVRYLSIFGSLNKLPLSSFKFGRFVEVLDLEGCKDVKQQHIKEICRMLLLRYLSLRKTDIKKLTKRIGDLLLLETLDIRETDVIELPNAICNLEDLVNIFGGNKRTRKGFKLPRELGKRGKMKALRILTGIEISEERSGAANLHQLTNLMKLAIYNLNINKEGSNYNELSSSIEYIGGYSLRALVIHDESAEFLKSLGDLSCPPMFLNALELSGKLVELPEWIPKLDALTKLTLSVTILQADNLELLSKICSLFSLTFSLNAAKQDEETAAIIEDNKACSDGVISFPVGGFENLKLLRFFAPYVPQLSFPDGAVPTLERLELRFSNFEGLVGIRGLKNLQQVYIKVQDEASETTESIIKEMATAAREDRDGPRIIVD